ncbi:MAG: FAD-binding protein [bacterium]|nr:FAD-binding protein [bacterium]
MLPHLERDLRQQLGAGKVASDPLDLYVFGKDAGLVRGESSLIAFPTSTEDVVTIARLAARHGVPVIPRGSGTGLAGGVVATGQALLMVTTRMNRIGEVDIENRMVWVQPGVINQDLSTFTAPLGLYFVPDPSSQSVCTIGGNVANNSGGLHCLAEGTTVNHVLAVEVVTADGEVVVLGSSSPDPIGLDLRGVMVGSEGTLGIVTDVLVKLTPNPPAVRTLLLAFGSVEDAAATVSGIIANGLVPGALEMMDRAMTQAVERFAHAGFPTEAEALLIAEVTGHPSAVDAEADLIRRVGRSHSATLIRVAVEESERKRIWLGRKSAFGAIAQMNPDYYLHDTVVPRTRLVEAIKQVYVIGKRHGIPMLNVFHAGDGNLHPLMTFDASQPGVLDRVHAAGKDLIEACVAVGGSLSGEHGIGLEKRDYMPLIFDDVGLDAQARVREAFDPEGRLNPGKILPEGSRCFDFGRPPPVGAWV